MYTMKETCTKTNLSYETLKFYCNQGLVPNVKRDSKNHRVFDDRDGAWINSLSCSEYYISKSENVKIIEITISKVYY